MNQETYNFIRRFIVTSASMVTIYAVYASYQNYKRGKYNRLLTKTLDTISEKDEPVSACSREKIETCEQGDGCCQNQNVSDDDSELVYSNVSDEEMPPDQISIGAGSHDGPLIDIEDIGARVNENEMNLDQDSTSGETGSDGEKVPSSQVKIHKKNKKISSIPVNSVAEKFKNHQEMIEEELRNTLTKQGYKLVGSHSGVKLCRWTKSMLRGQGGCYKHTFYGIASHQCMESTPNLACANKCVFCWRHQKNPTGTEWKWKLDTAETVFEGLLEKHYKMIKQFRGVPGVTPQTMIEGMKLRHAALSLVGEPIMYPEINRFIDLLHLNGISSFLVTNGTFPDQIKDVRTCTQLYLSCDAPTEKTHKKVDRPLFKDAWKRFIKSCENLSTRKERTIFRLTVVKGWNDEELGNYSQLAMIGKPDFIEVKGVTYCGTSWAGNTEDNTVLALKNVPYHEEVVDICQQLCEHINSYIQSEAEANPNDPEISSWPDRFEYVVASEHAHSNCVCIANKKKFWINGKWHTHIDFDKFIELQASGKPFEALDYTIETPEWAVFGHESRGFNPDMTRVYRKGANKRAQKERESETSSVQIAL